MTFRHLKIVNQLSDKKERPGERQSEKGKLGERERLIIVACSHGGRPRDQHEKHGIGGLRTSSETRSSAESAVRPQVPVHHAGPNKFQKEI